MGTTSQIKGRVTKRKFIYWINQEFKRFGITEYEIVSVEQTRYRGHEYEAGAAFLSVKFDLVSNRTNSSCGFFSCFYSLGMYTDHLKMGYEMYLQFKRHRLLSDLVVDLRRK